VAHEVTNVGTDRHQLSNIAKQARTEMGVETLDAVADRGYFSNAFSSSLPVTTGKQPCGRLSPKYSKSQR